MEPNQLYFKHANKDYLELSAKLGFSPTADPVILQLYSEPMQKFRLAARRHGDIQPPEQHRSRVDAYFDPLPIWYAPFEDEVIDEAEFPLHAITQRPAAMYHSWGSMNAWLRQIHGWNPLYIPLELAASKGIETGDWVYLKSRHGRIKAIARVMDGVNSRTVWTWNAIGKRKGAWNLAEDAEESNNGFLMNHLIDDLLPARENGYRYACADPVTGQAAWYDLRVSLEKAPAEAGVTEPQFPALPIVPGVAPRPDTVRYGAPHGANTGGDD